MNVISKERQNVMFYSSRVYIYILPVRRDNESILIFVQKITIINLLHVQDYVYHPLYSVPV